MPQITVLYFAGIAERLGITSERLEFPVESTVSTIIAQLGAAHPQIAALLPTCRLAVDQQFASGAVMLSRDSELAVIPPVSGG